MLSHFARLAASIGHDRTRHLLVACGLLIGLTLATVMTWFVMELRQHAIADATRELRNDALMLAEEMDRLLQSVDLVQQSLIEHMREIGIDSPEKFEHQMSLARGAPGSWATDCRPPPYRFAFAERPARWIGELLAFLAATGDR